MVGTDQLLTLAGRDRARLLMCSTNEVYGDPLVHPEVETYWGNVNATGPRACYDEGKRAAETLCFDAERRGAVDVRVARIFNTYGERLLGWRPKVDLDTGLRQTIGHFERRLDPPAVRYARQRAEASTVTG